MSSPTFRSLKCGACDTRWGGRDVPAVCPECNSAVVLMLAWIPANPEPARKRDRFADAPMVFYGDVVSTPLGFAPSHDRPPYEVVLPDREF